MAILLIDSSDDAAIGDATSSPSFDSTGATLCLISVSWYPGTTPDPSNVLDSKSNTYNALTKYTTATLASARLWYSVPTTLGVLHTGTSMGANLFQAMTFSAWSGVAASPFDVENGFATTNASTIQPGSVSPSEDNCLIVTAVCYGDNGAAAVSINQGFTIIEDSAYNSGVSMGMAFAYLIQTDGAAVNPTWNLTNNTNELATAIAVFKGPGGDEPTVTLMGQGIM